MDSIKYRPVMLGALGIGFLAAAFLPAMKISIISFFGAIPMEISLREATNALVNTGKGWVVLLALAGLIIVLRTLLVFDDADRERSRWWITGGTVLALMFPINLLGTLDSTFAESDAEDIAMLDTSLGAGMIILSIAFIAVTGLAWYASTQAPTHSTPAAPISTYIGDRATLDRTG